MLLIASLPADYQALEAADQWRGYRIPEGGLEPKGTLQMLQAWSARLQATQGWGTWLAVEGGEVVASLAVKDPPVEGRVEIGYAVAPARRGRGLATSAVAALLQILPGLGVTKVIAETARDNPASARVLQKVGFAGAGERADPEDGVLDLWGCDLAVLT